MEQKIFKQNPDLEEKKQRNSLVSASLKDSSHFVKRWVKNQFWVPSIYLLIGELGSGKSTFVKDCLLHLQVIDSARQFSSPSFALLNEYSAHESLLPDSIEAVHHVDLYRIHTDREFQALDIFEVENIVYFIEWPERVATRLFTEQSLPLTSIYFTIVNETTRAISFQEGAAK